jgi:hypothetical protein
MKLSVTVIMIHWVLPSLRKASIIPEDRTVIISQFAFLDILSNGIRSFFSRNLHFSLSVLWNFIDEIIEVTIFKRDIVPRRNCFVSIFEHNSEIQSPYFSNRGTGNGSMCRNARIIKRQE